MAGETQLLHICRGSFAGVVATWPMTRLMEHFDRARIEQPQTDLPPRIIAREVIQATADTAPQEEVLQPFTVVAHYAYGGAMGAVFSSMNQPRTLHGSAMAGGLFGLGVWAASYCGLLPVLGSRARATCRPAAVNANMITAHLVWGIALGIAMAAPNSRSSDRD